MGWDAFTKQVAGLPDAAGRGDRRDLVRVMGGMLTRNVLRGGLKIVVAGFLAPRALGILRAVYSFFVIVTSLLELGLNHAMVTFVSAAIGRGDRRDAEQVMRVVMGLNLGLIAGAVFLGNLFAAPLAGWALGDLALTGWLRVAFLAVGGKLLWSYASSILSAHQEFGKLALFLPTAPFLMLVAAGACMAAGRFDLDTALAIYLLAPAAAVLLWWLGLRRLLRPPAWSAPIARRVLGFSRWVYATNLASTVRNHANTLLLKSPVLAGSVAAGEASAGLYAFGSDLAAEVTVFSESLMTVMLPKAAGSPDRAELRAFVRRAYRQVVLLLVPLALLMLLARPFLGLLGWIRESYLAYLPSLNVFLILYAGSLFTIASIPMLTVLYALRLPRFQARVEMVMAVLVIAGAALLIPRYGADGAAWVLFAQRGVTCLLILGYGLTKLRAPGEPT